MKGDEQLLAELKEATEGLIFMSESDYPLEVIRWEGTNEISPEYIRESAGQPPAEPLKITSADESFKVAASEAEWKSKEELDTAKRYQTLVRLLKENLTDLKVYRVGEINIPVYVIGRHAAGSWMGVSTRVVET